jgi:hypothetical protein
MRVGEREADSTLANALSMSQLSDLDRDAATPEVKVVARVVDRWLEHFKKCGITRGDIDLYAEQIDRPLLAEQRREFVGGGPKQ